MRHYMLSSMIAIVGVTIIVVTGLLTGIDGVLAMTGLTLIGGLGGYGVGRMKQGGKT